MKILVTGGAGFIGSHLVERFASRADEIVVLDDLSRRGSEWNLEELRRLVPNLTFVQADICDPGRIDAIFREHRDVDAVFHMAAQVAVTTSVDDPRHDFAVNAYGTFNILEAIRQHAPGAAVIYASTNKVYGGMEDVVIEARGDRYVYRDLPEGAGEDRPLDFHSPYGCSKGAADQYVRDYFRIYGIRTVVFRQSAIYGTRQFGVEDQGWVAWFAIAAVMGRPITIFGDGKQVRDVLWVRDLADAYEAAFDRIDDVAGDVFNIGGGPAHTLSIWNEFGPKLERCLGQTIPVAHDDWRPGDQRVCVMDVSKAHKRLGWTPTTSFDQGLEELAEWVKSHKDLLTKVLSG